MAIPQIRNYLRTYTSPLAAAVDLTQLDGRESVPAEWIEFVSAGTVVLIDGSRSQQTITESVAGKIYRFEIRKLISTTATIRVGAGEAVDDGPVPLQGLQGATGATGAPGPDFTVTAVQTAAYTAAAGELVRADPSGGAFAVTLPSAVGIAGQRVAVKNVTSSVNVITIDGDGTETIDGALTTTITSAFGYVEMVSDGANWMIAGIA